MKPACTRSRDWLATRGEEAAPPALAHLARCTECRAVAARYDALVETLVALGETDPTAAAEQDFLARVRTALSGPEHAVTEPPRAPVRRGWLVLLAAAALALVVGRSLQPSQPARLEPVEATAWLAVAEHVETAAESTVLRGPQGLTVEVGPRSTLEVLEWGAEQVVLSLAAGEVDVRVDAHERLEVRTANSHVVVVGTAFAVRWDADDGTWVGVEEGTVRVEALDGTLLREVSAPEQWRVPVLREEVSEAPVAVSVAAPSPAEAPAMTEAVAEPPAEPPARSRMAQARALLAAGDVAAALALLEPEPAAHWDEAMLLGDALALADRSEEAEQAYQSALALGGPDAVVLVELARLQCDVLQQPERAGRTWRRYLSSHPAGRHANEARLFLAERRPADTVALLRAVLDSASGATWQQAFTLLAAHHLAEEDWAGARTLLAPYRDQRGAVGEVALVGLLRVAIAVGDKREARALLATYRARHPDGERRDEVAHLEGAVRY